MKDSKIFEISSKKYKDAYLIVGLPGIGLIGKTVADHLIKELNAKKIADLYSPHFPHQVFMTGSGTLRAIKNEFYHAKAGKNDLIILTGDVQAITSPGQYEISGIIVEYCKKIGVKTLITLGGYSSGKLGDNKRVFALVTDKELIPKLKKLGIIFGKAKGSIVGAAGMLPIFGKLAGLKGICLLGETHGAYVDVASAKDLLIALSGYLKFKVDLKQMDKKAKEGEQMLKKIEEELKRTMIQTPEFSKQDVSYIR